MLLPHCLLDCSGRAAIRTFPADLVPWGIEVGSSNISRIALVVFFLYSIAIANANICDGIDTYTNNLTWHSCIHSSIPPST